MTRLQVFRSYLTTIRLAAEMAWKQMMVDSFVLFTIVVQPLIVALLALWMLRDSRPDAAIFVVVGSGMTGLWSSMVFISGNSISGERWSGTLETLVGMPTPLSVGVIGRNLANVSHSLLSMVAAYAAASLFMGYALTIAHPLWFLGSVLLTVLAFVAMGLVLSPIYLLSPAVNQFANAIEFPIYILCGFLFPIALLPDMVTPLSYLLTPYWAARALHEAAHGSGDAGVMLSSWGFLLLSSAIYFYLAGGFFRYILRRVRIDGTLGSV